MFVEKAKSLSIVIILLRMKDKPVDKSVHNIFLETKKIAASEGFRCG